VRIEVQLIMTDRTLLAGSAEPAVLPGYGILPAQTARDLIRREATTKEPVGPDKSARTWLRRLYTAPSTGQLVGMDSRSRLVPEGLARFIAARDQVCRMPWCGAPVRHYDHIRPVRAGGTTSAENIQGLCLQPGQGSTGLDHTHHGRGWFPARPAHRFKGRDSYRRRQRRERRQPEHSRPGPGRPRQAHSGNGDAHWTPLLLSVSGASGNHRHHRKRLGGNCITGDQ
jgi:hypothetical protein